MVRAAVASVSGTAIDSRGRPLVGETVSLSQTFPNAGTNARSFKYGGTLVEADVTFTIKNVPPGDYKLVLRYVVRDGSGARVEEAGAAPLTVNGVDVHDLRFVTSRWHGPRSTVHGPRHCSSYPHANRVKIVGRTLIEDADLKVGGIDDSGDWQEDGTFYVGGLFGRTRIRAILPEGWMLKAVLRDGCDITGRVRRLAQPRTHLGDPADRLGPRDGGHRPGHRRQERAGGRRHRHNLTGTRTSGADESRCIRAVRLDEQGQFEIRASGRRPSDRRDRLHRGRRVERSGLPRVRFAARAAPLVTDGGAAAISLKLFAP